jgi:hypothetical protein
MSDFLDRLAVRAIGSGPLLAPRLPSLFEPLQRAPIMPVFEAGEATPPRRETAPAATVSPAAVPPRVAHAPVTATPPGSAVARTVTDPTPAPMPPHAAASAPDTVTPRAPIAAATSPPVTERAVPPPTPPRTADVRAPQPVRPRHTRIEADPVQATTSAPPTSGALLPASTPVFAAASAPARSSHAAMRPPAAHTGTANASAEPAVHVSIGRLEIRAAPASTTPARRRDGPQPSSLDDYLRQRGRKVAP